MQKVFYITKQRKVKVEIGRLLGYELFFKNNYRKPARRIAVWLVTFYLTIWIYDPNN
jgi:hypothetical protein